jgi:Fur family ferric uptake transcriptional regulator
VEEQGRCRDQIRGAGLRVTAPRVAVLGLLWEASSPLSHSEVVERLGERAWDPATTWRTLVKLTEVGLLEVASRAEGMARYAARRGEVAQEHHQHPHFVCDDCGRVSCLPGSLKVSLEVSGRWEASLSGAEVQLRGACPDCREVRLEGELQGAR